MMNLNATSRKEIPNSMSWQASSRAGIVAAGDARAVAIGIEILERDGNAADAAVATILALTVTDHGACSIGGEAPVLIFDAEKQEVKALCGQGRAPLSQTAIDWYMQNRTPGPGDIKLTLVPAVVDLVITLLKRYGTLTLEEVVAPTLALLDRRKEDWHGRLAFTLRRIVAEERIVMGSREEKLQAASDRFYGRNKFRDDIARELEAFYIQKGGFLRLADLAAHATLVEDPVTVSYRGYTVCKCGPWTQGPFVCQALRLLEGFDLKAMGHLSADYVHVIAEATKLAMADRDEYYGDPAFVDVPLTVLLSDAYTKIRRPLVDLQKASLEARPGDPYHMKPSKHQSVAHQGSAGTTTCVVGDRWGNVVSATPSANVFLEKVDGGRAGVTYGNRLLSFNTSLGHPNCIQPGKLPRVTPSPTLVLKNGWPILAMSVASGDLQDQTTLKLLLDFIEFGIPPEVAVTGPRFATSHHQNSFDANSDRARTFVRAGSLTVNNSLSESVQKELSRRGHQIQTTASPIAAPVMLYIDQAARMFYAAGDPAAHRHAAGLVEK